MRLDPLRALLQEGAERGLYAGAAAAVADASGALNSFEVGEARVAPDQERAPVTPSTLWDLASLTKPLAGSALVLALAEERMLSLDDGISRFDHLFKRTRFDGVTLRRLLTHTAGHADWFPLFVRGEGRTAYRKTLASLDPSAAPGTTVLYSCLGFLLLSEVVERVAGLPIDRFFRERIAEPLGLAKDLLFSPEGDDARRAAGGERNDATERRKTANLGLSYGGFRTGVVNGQVNDGNAWRRGAGVSLNAGLFGTARAVAEAAGAWLRRDPRLLRESSIEAAVANATSDLNEARGLGWSLASSVKSVGTVIARASYGHTGFTGSSVFVDPEANRVYVLLANRVHPEARSAEEMTAFRARFHDEAGRI